MYILLSDKRYVYQPSFRFVTAISQQKIKVRFSNDLVLSFAEQFPEQMGYFTSAAEAAFMCLNPVDRNNHRFHIELDLKSLSGESVNLQQESSSVGLGYGLGCALAMRDKLSKVSAASQSLFATGEVSPTGNVKRVGAITEKVLGALHAYDTLQEKQSAGDAFTIFLPKENEPDVSSELKEQVIANNGTFCFVEHISQALKYLLGETYDGSVEHRSLSFKGLNSFDFHDASYFFGREDEISDVVSMVESEHDLIKVHGVSGAGKSSLIKAGVLPKVCANTPSTKWHCISPIDFSDAESMMKTLLLSNNAGIMNKNGFSDQSLNVIVQQLLEGDVSIVKGHLLPLDSPVVWYIDQFEETYHRSFHPSLLDALALLAREIKPLTIIFSIKSEYNDLVGGIGKGYYLEHQLPIKSWHAILLEQSMSFGIKLDDELVEEIESQVIKLEHPLPVVEYLLSQMHEVATSSGNGKQLTIEHYEQVGGTLGVIAKQAQHILSLSEIICWEFFEIFIGINGDLKPYAKRVNLDELKAGNESLFVLIQQFIDKQLIIRHDVSSKECIVKLAHDCLIQTHQEGHALWPEFVKWFNQQQEYLIWRNHIESRFDKWRFSGTNETRYLLRGDDLIEGMDFLRQNGVIHYQPMRDFIDASKRYDEQKIVRANRKQRILFSVFSSMSVVIIVLFLGIILQSKKTMQALSLANQNMLLVFEDNIQFWRNQLSIEQRQNLITRFSDWEQQYVSIAESELGKAQQLRLIWLQLTLRKDEVNSDLGLSQKRIQEIQDVMAQWKQNLPDSLNTDKREVAAQLYYAAVILGELSGQSMAHYDNEEAEIALKFAVSLLDRIPANYELGKTYQAKAKIVRYLAQFEQLKGNNSSAETLYKQSLELIQQALVQSPEEVLFLTFEADLYRKLSQVSPQSNKTDYINLALERLTQLQERFPADKQILYKTAKSYIAQSDSAHSTEQELESLNNALKVTHKLLSFDSSQNNYLFTLVYIQYRFGYAYMQQQKISEGERAIAEAKSALKTLLSIDPKNSEWLELSARVDLVEGQLHQVKPDLTLAVNSIEKAIQSYRVLHQQDPERREIMVGLFDANQELAFLEYGRGDLNKAVIYLNETLKAAEGYHELLADNVSSYEITQRNFIYLYEELGDTQAACKFAGSLNASLSEAKRVNATSKRFTDVKKQVEDSSKRLGCDI